MKIITFFSFGIKLPGSRKENEVDQERTEGWEEICLSRAAQKKGTFALQGGTIRLLREGMGDFEKNILQAYLHQKNSCTRRLRKTKLSRTKILHTTTAENKTFTHENPALDNCGKQNFHARAGKKECNMRKNITHTYVPRKMRALFFFLKKVVLFFPQK